MRGAAATRAVGERAAGEGRASGRQVSAGRWSGERAGVAALGGATDSGWGRLRVRCLYWDAVGTHGRVSSGEVLAGDASSVPKGSPLHTTGSRETLRDARRGLPLVWTEAVTAWGRAGSERRIQRARGLRARTGWNGGS